MKDLINMRSFEGVVIADRYRLDRFLNEGAFGAVFKAGHIAYGMELREVAIKIARRPMMESETRQIFGDALIMTKVVDSVPDAEMKQHFVIVHDAGCCPENGQLAGHPYMVMEFVNGISLEGCLRAGRFPLKRTMNYFDQILKAMAFMHGQVITTEDGKSRPIIHRDLKPGNILVTRRKDTPDVLKITDFGLAMEVDLLLGWVESGGTLSYLAPESFSHKISSPQSDVYMLGLIFYEMLSGENPFAEVGIHLRDTDEENYEEMCTLHLSARQLENFSCLENNEEIRQRPALKKVIRTALAADMNTRTYNNACELLAAWEQAKTEDGELPPPKSPWEEVRRLKGEAEQCFAVGDQERGERLLHQAMKINRDKSQVPDPMVVGSCYLLMVKCLLQRGKVEEAGKMAFEGNQRRMCRSTCLAVAKYYEGQNSVLALSFQQEAEKCEDQE